MNPSEPMPAQARLLADRLLTVPLAKAASTAALTGLFFVAYFFALRHPFFPVTIMPVGPIDRWIGFHPDAIVIYLSLWAYLSLGAALAGGRTELFRFWAAAGALAAVGIACFLACPTAVPPGLAEWSRSSPYAFLRDDAGNACPSLHSAFAVFVAAAIDAILRETGKSRLLRVCNAVWSAAIVWSTLAVKQHVIVDAIAGVALGTGAAIFHRKLRLGRRASQLTVPPPVTTA